MEKVRDQTLPKGEVVDIGVQWDLIIANERGRRFYMRLKSPDG